MKKILITGVAGFIGSHLTEEILKKGYNVIGIDNFDPFYDKNIKLDNLKFLNANPNFTFVEIDITEGNDMNKIFRENPDIIAVIHLAAKAGVRPSINNIDSYIDTNINGTKNLLNICVEQNIKKFVFASSSSVYGNTQQIPFSEDDYSIQTISPYAFTKKSGEILNYTYHSLYQLDIINLRLFTVYGPRQRPDLAIHKFVKAIYNKEKITLYGDGSTSRDYTFISDIVNGINKALDYILSHENVFEIVNLGNEDPIKLSELVNLITECTNKESIIEYSSTQPGDVEKTYASIKKAKMLLNYEPQVNLKEGIQFFIDWYLTNFK